MEINWLPSMRALSCIVPYLAHTFAVDTISNDIAGKLPIGCHLSDTFYMSSSSCLGCYCLILCMALTLSMLWHYFNWMILPVGTLFSNTIVCLQTIPIDIWLLFTNYHYIVLAPYIIVNFPNFHVKFKMNLIYIMKFMNLLLMSNIGSDILMVIFMFFYLFCCHDFLNTLKKMGFAHSHENDLFN